MTHPIPFLLELSLVWAVLLLCYLLIFRGRKDWRMQRHFLLLTLGIGLLLPLLPDLPVGLSVAPRATEWMVPPTAVPIDPVTSNPATAPATSPWFLLWAIGSAMVASFLGYRFALHLRPRPSQTETFATYRVIRSARVASPYAFWDRIYLPIGLSPELERTALLHEAAHLDRGHHRERLLLTLLLISLWFHPLLWLIARRLTVVQEFEADAAVLREVPRRTYGTQLLHATLAPRLVAGLFSSPLKQRIAMLTSPSPSRPLDRRVYGLLFLVLAALFVACSDATGLVPDEEVVFTLPEVQNAEDAPQLREGDFLQYFYERIRYPADLRNEGLTGAVAVDLRVGTAGEVTDIVTRKLDAATEADDRNSLVIVGYAEQEGTAENFSTDNRFAEEVQRVLAELPAFRPAERNGEPVPSVVRFDVVYKLE
jgi:beta-lactamase regulating signal transducer with metallopeptidase domain